MTALPGLRRFKNSDWIVYRDRPRLLRQESPETKGKDTMVWKYASVSHTALRRTRFGFSGAKVICGVTLMPMRL